MMLSITTKIIDFKKFGYLKSIHGVRGSHSRSNGASRTKNKIIDIRHMDITSAKLVGGSSTGKIGDDPKVETEIVKSNSRSYHV
ncbi:MULTISPECIES: hypothetical protein [Pseudoalteromonas]|uniref:hypothetical protein n=1 Tax=Pseudoalteromonas TaxID=53246 RepID=UPI00083DD9D2|nr:MULTISPECIES: hypothetical protein [Pseudoalteromonas]MCG9770069.1 hypothetical protein [Pseudoalteromonas piscicida]ODB37251.1 hypothetical protein BB427_13610 [Pseudoalteromonas sp. BMB]WMO15729.1 hypothetical protein NI376_09190 [Pseudoalteromonas piscicida]